MLPSTASNKVAKTGASGMAVLFLRSKERSALGGRGASSQAAIGATGDILYLAHWSTWLRIIKRRYAH
jgi:hypothetical protein